MSCGVICLDKKSLQRKSMGVFHITRVTITSDLSEIMSNQEHL